VAAVLTLLTGALTLPVRLKAAVDGHRQNHYTEVAVHRIAVIEGDGVGPEVIRESVKVLQAVTERDSRVRLQFDYYPWGTGY